MSTQNISDYLTKQIFIDRNIVTYRSLSRHLAIHVNVAKNELATYHHDAPYKSQTCAATYLLSGTVLRKYQHKDSDDDVDMDEVPTSTQEDNEDGDGDDVPQVQVTMVNEKDLEAAKASYDNIHSIHVYSLSPSLIHDAGLVCAPTEYVRNTDKTSTDMAGKVGRVVGADINMRSLKKGKQPIVPVAGPSKLKQPSIPETKPVVKESLPGINPKEKPKASGKFDFFKAKPKKIEEIKKEEPAKEVKKKMFFTKAPSPAPSVASDKTELEPATRGIKRKSSVGLEPRARTPDNPAVTSDVKVKGRVVLSDDESDTVAPPPKRILRRKSKVTPRTESPEREIDQAAMALMDIDDDQVEKVIHKTSPTANDDEDERMDDVDMADGTTPEPKKIRKKRAKITPVGSNGLKKKKVTKTRRLMDGNGYMRTEDYSDWESVDEEVEPEPPSRKGKRKAVTVKKEDVKKGDVKKEDVKTEAAPVVDSKDNLVEAQQVPQNTPVPAAKKKQVKTSKTKVKPQQGLLNFFGPKKS